MQEKLRELIAKVPHVYVNGPNCGWYDDRKGKICGKPPDAQGHIKYGCHLEVSGMHEFEPEQVHAKDCPTCAIAALAASEPAPQPEQIIEIDEDGKVHYPPCTCFTCPQHGPLLKAIEQREQLRRG